MNNVDILTAPAIAALVFTVMEAVAGLIPARAKPPLALLLGAAWALGAFYSIPDAYPSVLVAIAVGMTAGAAASGIDGYRTTYAKQTPAGQVADAGQVKAAPPPTGATSPPPRPTGA